MSLTPTYPTPRDLLKGKTVVVTAAAGTGIGYSAAKRAVEDHFDENQLLETICEIKKVTFKKIDEFELQFPRR